MKSAMGIKLTFINIQIDIYSFQCKRIWNIVMLFKRTVGSYLSIQIQGFIETHLHKMIWRVLLILKCFSVFDMFNNIKISDR